MKYIIIFLMAILMIGLASAIEDGDIITQDQLNNFNISNINAQFLKCAEGGATVNQLYLVKDFSCLDLEKISEDEYRVYTRNDSLLVSTRTIVNCLDRYSIEQCRSFIRRSLKIEFESYLVGVGNKVRYWQQVIIPSNWLAWLQDIFGL